MENIKNKRTCKEIKIDSYNNITVRIGTVDNRNSPETIYINVSFWVNIRNNDFDVNSKTAREHLENKIRKEFYKKILPILSSSKYFIDIDDIIFLINIPDSINSNNNKNFVDIELFLYTINAIDKSIKLPLNSKKSTFLYNECTKISDTFSQFDILNNKDIFSVHKKSA